MGGVEQIGAEPLDEEPAYGRYLGRAAGGENGVDVAVTQPGARQRIVGSRSDAGEVGGDQPLELGPRHIGFERVPAVSNAKRVRSASDSRILTSLIAP